MGGFQVFTGSNAPQPGTPAPAAGGPWRPPQWNNQKQLFSVTANLPSGSGSSSSSVSSGSGTVQTPSDLSSLGNSPATTATTYFFDGVLREEHFQELRKTEHPVQSGSSITDHAYLMPARLVAEIIMSDAQAAFQNGQFTSDPSKSISAYQVLLNIQSLRTPLSVVTRLNSYTNMFIESLRAPDTYQTRFGLRCTVVFAQIIVGTVTTTAPSERPNQTNNTPQGPQTPQSLPPNIQQLLNNMKTGGMN